MPVWLSTLLEHLGAGWTGGGLLALLTAAVVAYGERLKRGNSERMLAAGKPASQPAEGNAVAYTPDWQALYRQQYERNRELEVALDALRKQFVEVGRDNTVILGGLANMQNELRKSDARAEAIAGEFAAYRSRVESGHVPTASEPPGAPTVPPARPAGLPHLREIVIERTPFEPRKGHR